MAKEIKTSILIQAPKEQVWQVLMDFEAYPSWNNFVQSVQGTIAPGNQITVKLPGMTFKPRILKLEVHKEFKWLGHLWFKGIFDGEHRFAVESEGPNQTRFIHSEKFKGALASLVLLLIGKDTQKGFEEMNQALKQRVENL